MKRNNRVAVFPFAPWNYLQKSDWDDDENEELIFRGTPQDNHSDWPEWNPDLHSEKNVPTIPGQSSTAHLHWADRPAQAHASGSPRTLESLYYDDADIPQGVSFSNSVPHIRLRPPSAFPSGRYHSRLGSPDTPLYVKKGAVDPDSGLPRNATARNEYVAHRLMDVFATPDNGIRSVRATLHSEEHGGAPVPADYRWHPNMPAYVVTPQLRQRSGIASAQLNAPLPNTMIDKARQDFGRGVVVDALLAGEDMHGGNIMFNPGEDGVFRVDSGAYMGINPWGEKTDTKNGWHDPDAANLPILPHLHFAVKALGEGDVFHRRGLAARHPGGKDAWYLDMAHHILQQAQSVIDIYGEKAKEIHQIIGQHHDPEETRKILSGRIESLRKLLSTYSDDPQSLADDLQEDWPDYVTKRDTAKSFRY